MPFLLHPHLPTRPISSAVISCAVPLNMRNELIRRRIQLYINEENPTLAKPVCTHPDLSLFDFGNGTLLKDRSAVVSLPSQAQVIVGKTAITSQSPGDIAYDACLLGHYLFCKMESTAPEILRAPLVHVPVHQGYAKCSTAIVSEKAVITEDISIARAMRGVGIDVLELMPGSVSLPGYSYGFIGGACGKIASDILAFFGNIQLHPQYKEIDLFCKKYGVVPLSLSGSALTDYGSLIPLTE